MPRFLTKENNRILMHLKLSTEVLPNPKANPLGVLKLIADVAAEISNFQSESIQENENIIHGLEVLIKEIKNRN